MARNSLTDQQLQIIREGWTDGLSMVELCAAAGITIDTFKARRLDQLSDLPKRPRSCGSFKRGIDPTPEDIARMTAAIRASWNMEDWLRR
jgi:hypothetical protein